MLEILIALVIVAALTAIILPAVAGRVSPAGSAVLARSLQEMNTAILQYRENVGKYPHELLELTTRPTAGTSQDACRTTLTAAQVANWQGPYISLTAGTSGIQVGDALVENALQRTPSNTASSTVMNGLLQMSVENVTQAVASDVESIFDRGNDLDHGTITWIATAGSIGTLSFAIPVRGC